MPHDKQGNEIKAGDLVQVPCRVKAVYQTEDYCNVELETIDPMHPGNHTSSLTLNARQVEKLSPVSTA